MTIQRRRHHQHHSLRVLIPIISTISGVLLILFGLLSFLAPSPIDSDHLRRHSRRHSVHNLSFFTQFILRCAFYAVIHDSVCIILLVFLQSEMFDAAARVSVFSVPVRDSFLNHSNTYNIFLINDVVFHFGSYCT